MEKSGLSVTFQPIGKGLMIVGKDTITNDEITYAVPISGSYVRLDTLTVERHKTLIEEIEENLRSRGLTRQSEEITENFVYYR